MPELVQECLVGISILYFVAAIWEGASCSPASKLTQGVGFHRQHVLGHKASTPDRTDLIAQIEGGRANLFERAFVEGNISKENFKYFQEFG